MNDVKRYTADVFYHNHFSTVQMEVVRASDYDRLEVENKALRQHKTDYMEAAEETRRALQAELEALRPRVVVVPECPTYTTQPGESVGGIALRQLKDESRWVEIRDLNARDFPDMRSHDYYPVGTVLKLPARLNGKTVSEELLWCIADMLDDICHGSAIRERTARPARRGEGGWQ
ncbi:hypothetical protein D3C78_401780 [compost metagenome]